MVKIREKCPLCNSVNIRLFKKGTINISNLKPGDFKITDSCYGSRWTLYRCMACSFVFSNPYLAGDEIKEMYSNLEDNEYSKEVEGRSKNFKLILKRIKKLVKDKTTLLDVGAASGIFLKLCNEEGYITKGIEPSAALVREAKESYGIDLYEGTISDFRSNKKYSVITLLDVIEHVPDPEEFMGHVARLSGRNGLLVVVTPDISSLASKITQKRWWHYRVAHVNFFNMSSLEFLLKKHGFTIVLKKRYTWNFSLYYILSRLFPALKKDNTLQKFLKIINLKLQFFDSWEVYAKKD